MVENITDVVFFSLVLFSCVQHGALQQGIPKIREGEKQETGRS